MARYQENRYAYENVSPDPDMTTLLTIEGYKKLYEKCEGSSDVVLCQKRLYKAYHVNDWMNKLSKMNLLDSVDCLFRLSQNLFPSEKLEYPNDYLTLIQIYSLLENVFRNVLLHPYIPAYRTINKDCGRYRSFIQFYENAVPFKELHFHTNGSNLLTYEEIDSKQTILYALTCSILCQYYTTRLNEIRKSPNVSEV